MGVPDSNLHDLERQRLALQDNILKLQRSLYQWRTWEAEYDGLREEISELGDDATDDDFLQVGREFGGTLVNEDEVKVFLGDRQGITRTRQQVVDLITRRMDYVKQNASTMEKRLRAAENDLHELDSIERLPAEPTADFPMTEIFEELDEEGNVVSTSTSKPGDEASSLLDVLKKAGVKDIPDSPATSTQQPTLTSGEQSSSNEDVEKSTATDGKEDDVKDSQPVSVGSSGAEHEERPVTEVDESPEDAKLRHEMLRYGLDEVGAVVAELELDDDASDASLEADYDDAFAYDEDDDEEEEDEYGRSTRPVLDENYHQQMRELEAKLNARGMWNMGKNTGSLPDDVKQDLNKPPISQPEDLSDEPIKEKKSKKKVAFAEDLDIAPASEPPALEKKVVPLSQSDTPISDSIVERTEPAEQTTVASAPSKKASRFKAGRNSSANSSSSKGLAPAPPTESSRSIDIHSSLRKPDRPSSSSSLPLFPAKPAEPKPFSEPISDLNENPPTGHGPEGKILADKLVERETRAGSAAAPELDELDEAMHRKEIASEFYHMRNRQIQQNGGFLEEPEQVPLGTEDAPRPMSKFRASRMR